jgi:hypothetical protein
VSSSITRMLVSGAGLGSVFIGNSKARIPRLLRILSLGHVEGLGFLQLLRFARAGMSCTSRP